MASMGDELCLCDWNEMPCAERNKHRLLRYMKAEFKIETSPILDQTKKQLDEYFAGNRKIFDIPLHPVGTDFQKKVWRALKDIPYGHTASYKELAENINCSKGFRAVGNANNKNRYAIVVPCHRVIGSNGNLVGYAGGLDIKKFLIEHENRVLKSMEEKLNG